MEHKLAETFAIDEHCYKRDDNVDTDHDGVRWLVAANRTGEVVSYSCHPAMRKSTVKFMHAPVAMDKGRVISAQQVTTTRWSEVAELFKDGGYIYELRRVVPRVEFFSWSTNNVDHAEKLLDAELIGSEQPYWLVRYSPPLPKVTREEKP